MLLIALFARLIGTPDFKPLYRDVRVDAGLYAGDDVAAVATEVAMAADLFSRTFARLTDEQLVATLGGPDLAGPLAVSGYHA